MLPDERQIEFAAKLRKRGQITVDHLMLETLGIAEGDVLVLRIVGVRGARWDTPRARKR
ncbi:MAG: hypothetical protein IVW52_05060 [Acidimicrobiales bacterium]|nr:hypothetical protein [Acidimicrobiales bacterium]